MYYYWLTFPPTDPNSTDFHKYIVNNQIGFEDFIDLQEAQNTLSKSYFPEINLEKFHFIGIQEFFREDLRELQHLLNWPEVKIKPSNGNTYPDYKARVRNILGDRQLIRKIATVNREDMELYQAALNLRGKRKGLSNSLQQYQVCLQASQQRLLYTEVVPQKDKAVLDTINTLHN
ncbi:hypothetical protein [Laspinema olomoucense]|uniref:hypothetical protein n=1 Tax=Laspinema olomoucense TaxID=3231600 RepID=UPI0021BB613F|nr:hypothetical protein [Laspinema sp. D3d]